MNDIVLAWSDAILDLHDLLRDDAPTAEPIYLVGGVVRDALLRRPIKDVDIAVARGGIKLARRIANHFGGAFFPLDAERDVGRALIDTFDGRLSIDVAGFRGDSLDADLWDRDFTVNALAVDLRGDLNAIIDPTGGAADVLAKLICQCNPDAIARDPIRALRAVRLSAQFGFRIERATQDAIRVYAPSLLDTSIERVRDELFKLLALPKPAAALRVADHLGLLTMIFPELIALHGLKQDEKHAHDAWNHTLAVVENLSEILAVISPNRSDATTAKFNLGMIAVGLDRFRGRLQEHLAQVGADDRPHRALLMLAALLHDVGKGIVTPIRDTDGHLRFRDHDAVGADALVERVAALHLSKAEQERVILLVRQHMLTILWRGELDALAIYRFWRQMGEGGIDLLLLLLADYLGALGAAYVQDDWILEVERTQTLLHAYFEEYDRLVEPPPLVDGRQLMRALALQPGPVVGDLLDRIREAQVVDEIHTADEAIQFARSIVESGGGEN